MNGRKLQVRVPDSQYGALCSMLREDETVSDFIRESIKLQIELRMLAGAPPAKPI